MREQTNAGLAASRLLVDRLGKGEVQPLSFQEAADAVQRDQPELARELSRLVSAGPSVEAMRLLRRHVDVGLVTARDLVAALVLPDR